MLVCVGRRSALVPLRVRTSFFNLDVVSIPTISLHEGEIPHEQDWKFLYELEIPDDKWAETALDELVYTKLRAWPRPGILDRWPSLRVELLFTESEVRKEVYLNVWHPPRRDGRSSIESTEFSDNAAFFFSLSVSQASENGQGLDSDGPSRNALVLGEYDSDVSS